MRLNIVKNLTRINFTDTNNEKRVKYIVIHYFGSLGTAKSVSNYFKTSYRGASAHYMLDAGNEVFQSVEVSDSAWHCGTSGKYKHPFCRNSNSIGVEVRPYKLNTNSMKSDDRDWYFDEKTIDNLVEFTRYLMNKYNVPIENVVRHYDVTGKLCPRPFVGNDKNKYYKKTGNQMWKEFKKRLEDTESNNKNNTSDKKKDTSKEKDNSKSVAFKVKVTADVLNIRKGPGVSHDITGQIKDKGVYTIVDKDNGWGKLKSGKGWISLDYTKKV